VLHGDKDVALGMPLLAGAEAGFDAAAGGVEIKVLENCSHWVQQVRGGRGRVMCRGVLGGSWEFEQSSYRLMIFDTPQIPHPQDYPIQVNSLMRDWLRRQDSK
jgi:hypothetical protein